MLGVWVLSYSTDLAACEELATFRSETMIDKDQRDSANESPV